MTSLNTLGIWGYTPCGTSRKMQRKVLEEITKYCKIKYFGFFASIDELDFDPTMTGLKEINCTYEPDRIPMSLFTSSRQTLTTTILLGVEPTVCPKMLHLKFPLLTSLFLSAKIENASKCDIILFLKSHPNITVLRLFVMSETRAGTGMCNGVDPTLIRPTFLPSLKHLQCYAHDLLVFLNQNVASLRNLETFRLVFERRHAPIQQLIDSVEAAAAENHHHPYAGRLPALTDLFFYLDPHTSPFANRARLFEAFAVLAPNVHNLCVKSLRFTPKHYKASVCGGAAIRPFAESYSPTLVVRMGHVCAMRLLLHSKHSAQRPRAFPPSAISCSRPSLTRHISSKPGNATAGDKAIGLQCGGRPGALRLAPPSLLRLAPPSLLPTRVYLQIKRTESFASAFLMISVLR
ncbi:hypothetical protein AX16_009068 [Volvariella volvacea WC 439]|nr:hypothetical protein AX16_009068 [Volvariella volvacea WC 439]